MGSNINFEENRLDDKIFKKKWMIKSNNFSFNTHAIQSTNIPKS